MIIYIISKKVEKGMFMNEFEININGVDKIAHIVTRLELENTGIEYIYYNVDNEKNVDDEYLLFASRIENNENGTEEIIELDKHKIALLKQSIENQISILNSLNELSTSLKSAESKVIIRIDDFQKHYDEISGKHQAFTVSSLKDIKRGINNGRI